MKKIISIALLGTLMFACTSAPKSEVIKVVGKEKITKEEVQKELDYIGIGNDENLKNDVIESLTLQKILKQEAEKLGVHKEKNYKDELQRMERMLLATMVLEREVYQKVAKDEELLTKYFEENKKDYDFEKVKIAHIVIKNQDMTQEVKKEALKKAELILERALKGENFYSLAREYSESPDAKWGGEIGYITRGDMVTKIEEVAFGNPVGVYNKVVESIYGYEIIYIIDKKGAVKSIKDLSDNEKNEIKDMLLNDYYNNYIKNLKKSFGVE